MYYFAGSGESLLAALARVGFAVEISESDSMEIVESETGARAGISLSTVANFSGGVCG